MQMNYTAFFLTLSAVGFVVFVGIFGAAWMSAAERQPQGIMPVLPSRPPQQTTQPPQQTTLPPQQTTLLPETTVTDWSNDSPSTTSDGSISSTPFSTTQVSSTLGLKEDTSLLGFTHASTEKLDEKSPKPTEILNGSRKISPVDLPEPNITPETSTCTYETLTDVKGEIKPEYINEDKCLIWLVEYEEGYDVDLTVDRLDLDGDANDYVLISPDEDTTTDENNPVLTWKLTKQRVYKIPNKGKAYILFVTHYSSSRPEKPEGFRIIYRRSGELTTTESTATDNPIPTPPTDNKERIVVSIDVKDFDAKEVQFRTEVAKQANVFCEENGIVLNNAATYENVYLSNITPCLSTWPNSEDCLTLTMAIPVDTKSSKTYELKKENLQKMWDEWDASGLQNIEISKATGPNYKKKVIISSIICTAFIILFTIVLIFLWKWQLKYSYKHEENKDLPSEPIEVPPLFDYFDTRLDDMPEYDMPYYDFPYQMGTETSTDDINVSYSSYAPYNQRYNNSSNYHFSRPSNAGIDNNSFIPEEDEDEYEIMNRASLTKEVKKMNKETEIKMSEIDVTNKEESSS